MRIYRIRKFPTGIFLLVLAVIVIVFNSKILPHIEGTAFEIVIKPFRILKGVKSCFFRPDYLEENTRLKQQIGALSVALTRMNELKRENERLYDVLDFKKNLPYDVIAARVIARNPTDWRKSMVINKGKRHGINEGMPCATTRGLIGRVEKVFQDSSRIMLITDPNSRIGVLLEDSRESGLLIGSPPGECRVIYLPLDGRLAKGEKVVAAGFNKRMPKGMVIGEVVAIGVENSNLYRYVIVKPFEDAGRVEEVLCIDVGQ